MGRRPDPKPRGRPPKAGQGGGSSAPPSRAPSPGPEEPDVSAATLLGASGARRTRKRSNSLQPPDPTAGGASSNDERTSTWGGRGRRQPSPGPSAGRSRATSPSSPTYFFNGEAQPHGKDQRPFKDNPPPKGKARKPPRAPLVKPDKLPLEAWMRPHTFMRADYTNGIRTDEWLAFADKAFPGDIMFVGSLLLTELWLAIQVMPPDLWVELRALICATLTAIYKESTLPQRKVQVAVEKLWAFLRTLRFSSLDRVCQLAGIQIVSTEGIDEYGTAPDLLLAGFFKQQDFKANTLCRHIPTVAQRAAGDAVDRESDPPVSEAIKSICWLAFFGARCAASCTAHSVVDKCTCPHHIRFGSGAVFGASPDDMFNRARSCAQDFFERDLEMSINSGALGDLNKMGVAYVAKLVRRRSLSQPLVASLALPSPLSSSGASSSSGAFSLPSEATCTQGTTSKTAQDTDSDRTLLASARLKAGGSSSESDKSDATNGITTTGFAARATKVSKPRLVVKPRKPIPTMIKKAEVPKDATTKPEDSKAKDSQVNSQPWNRRISEAIPSAPKSVLLSKSALAAKHDPTSKPGSSKPSAVKPSAKLEPAKAIVPPHNRARIEKTVQDEVTSALQSTTPTIPSILQPAPKGANSNSALSEEDLSLIDSTLPTMPLSVLRYNLDSLSAFAEQSSGPTKRLVERLAEKIAMCIVGRNRPADLSTFEDGRTPGFGDPVDIHTTYHIFVGKSHQHRIVFQRGARFEDLLEQWMRHIISLKASLPGAVIPPSRYMFCWKGRPLKLTETPASVGMQWKEDVFVVDSMDAALALRTHDAGLCNEVLRTILFRDMLRMQQGLDPAPEGIALSHGIEKRYKENPNLKQEESGSKVEGNLGIITNTTAVSSPAQNHTQPRAQAPGSASKVPLPHHTTGSAAQDQLTRIFKDSPARRLLAHNRLVDWQPAQPHARHRRFQSVQLGEAPRPQERPSSLQLARPPPLPHALGSPVQIISDAKQMPKDTPLRPFKLNSQLRTKDGIKTPDSESQMLPDTPTKVKGFTPLALLPAAVLSTLPNQLVSERKYSMLRASILEPPPGSPRRTLFQPFQTIAPPKPQIPELPFTRQPGPTFQDSPKGPRSAALAPSLGEKQGHREITSDLLEKEVPVASPPSTPPPKRQSLFRRSRPGTPTVQHSRSRSLRSAWGGTKSSKRGSRESPYDQSPEYVESVYEPHVAPPPPPVRDESTLRRAIRFGLSGLWGE